MKLYLRFLIFIISVLILALILFVEYIWGKRRGLKRALYRISYRSVSVILAFLVAPYLNEYIINYNLYSMGLAIHYNGLHFYRIIDFVEEVIVHNEVLNDIYYLFPSLKNILMDFPQIIVIPFTFVGTFIVISLLLLPLYLYLSYKRKRRILYDKVSNKKSLVWAGILTAVQSVLLISIILTPINGISRIYKDARKDLIDSESNICNQNEYLNKYEIACEIIEGYNNSLISLVTTPFDDYLFSSLTRVHYNNTNTSLNKEIVSVARAGIVLNKTGLMQAVNAKNFDDVTALHFNELTEEDIDVVVEAFEESLYTKDVVFEVYEWAKQYLDWLIRDLVDEKFTSDYEYDDIVGELKIILRAINYIINHEELFNEIKEIYALIVQYNENEDYTVKGKTVKLLFDIAYRIDVDMLIEVYSILKESKIYNEFVPQILDHLLSLIGIRSNLKHSNSSLHTTVAYALQCLKYIQNHKYVYTLLHLFNDLTIEEVHFLAEFLNYLNSSPGLENFAHDLMVWGIDHLQLKLELPFDLIYRVKDWTRELEMGQIIVQIVYKGINTSEVDYDRILYIINNYSDTECFKEAFNFLVKNLPDIVKTWLIGKDYKYLVGEYV